MADGRPEGTAVKAAGYLLAGCVILVALSWPGPHVFGAPSSQGGTFETGLNAFERGAFDQAIERWTEALQTAAQSGRTDARITLLIHLSDARMAMGHYRRATDDLQAALGLAQQAGDARRPVIEAHLGNALLPTGRTDVAAELLQHAAPGLGDAVAVQEPEHDEQPGQGAEHVDRVGADQRVEGGPVHAGRHRQPEVHQAGPLVPLHGEEDRAHRRRRR